MGVVLWVDGRFGYQDRDSLTLELEWADWVYLLYIILDMIIRYFRGTIFGPFPYSMYPKAPILRKMQIK